MTDIIERLERQWAALDPVDEYRADARDAIDEIKRLRAELDALKAQEPNEDLADIVSKAMRRAWQFGQTYWQQADSEYFSQNKKADETEAKFQALVDETRSAVLAPQPAIPDGFVLVPKEHTKDVAHAMEVLIADGYASYQDAWADMLGTASNQQPHGWTAIHLKTGNEYCVTGERTNTTNAPVHCGAGMVDYERDGVKYAREAGEFMEKFVAKGAAK